MTPFSELTVNGTDQNGDTVAFIFYKRPKFTVYWASRPETNSQSNTMFSTGSLRIQYANDEAIADLQDRAMAPIQSVMSDIEILISGWRQETWTWYRIGTWFPSASYRRAEYYTWRMADAATQALLGFGPTAADLLERTKNSVVADRMARGRYNYLATALLVALTLLLVTKVGGSIAAVEGAPADTIGRQTWANLTELRWRMAAIGALGAFFSVAIGLRDRTIDTDLNSLNNFVDASVRITVGAISGAVMAWLIFGGIIPLAFAVTGAEPVVTAAPAPSDPSGSGLMAVVKGAMQSPHLDLMRLYVAAFLAGFAERMVPELLNRTTIALQQPAAKLPVAPVGTAANPVGPGNPAGASDALQTGGSTNATADAVPVTAAEAEDCCGEERTLDPSDVTEDVELPPTTGGVAASNDGQTA